MQDIVNMVALIIVAIFIYMVIFGYIMKRKKKNGKMNPKGLIEWTAVEMSSELQRHGYSEYNYRSLETVKSIDAYIEKKLEIYDADSILNDKDFIFRCGSLVGQLVSIKKHWSWKFTEDKIPYLVKKGKVSYPFEIVKQKIRGEIESIYDFLVNPAYETNIAQTEKNMLFRKSDKSFWETLQKGKAEKIGAVNYKSVWEKHPHIPKEDFESIPKEERVEVLYDLASYFIFKEDDRTDEEKFSSFPEPLKTVYSVMSFEADVNCDGFNGFFINSHGFMAFDTLVALQKIGAEKTAEILKKALLAINRDGKSDEELKRAIADEEIEELYESDEMDEKLHELDNQFYESEENISALLEAYISQDFAGV